MINKKFILNADDFGLHGSADKDFKARAEQAAHHVHQDDGGEESADHERRTDKDAEQKKVSSLAVLACRPLAIGQSMGAEPERRGYKGFHHEDDPAYQS